MSSLYNSCLMIGRNYDNKIKRRFSWHCHVNSNDWFCTFSIAFWYVPLSVRSVITVALHEYLLICNIFKLILLMINYFRISEFNILRFTGFLLYMDSNVHHLDAGIVQTMYRKNGAGKIRSIYLLHCYPTVYLPELSSKLKTGYCAPEL